MYVFVIQNLGLEVVWKNGDFWAQIQALEVAAVLVQSRQGVHLDIYNMVNF